MAIEPGPNIGEFVLRFRNEDHRTNLGGVTYLGAQFPSFITYPDANPSIPTPDFTISFWIRLSADESIKFLKYTGPGASPAYWAFNADTTRGGNDIYWEYSEGKGDFTEIRLGNTALHAWMYLCYVRSGDTHTIYVTKEPEAGVASPPVIIPVTGPGGFPHQVHLNFPFDEFRLEFNGGMGLCSLKLYNYALTEAEVNANRLLWSYPAPAKPPLWISHLRRPGDLLNSAATVPNDFWHDNFEWTEAPDVSFLVYRTDPIQLQRVPCSTYLIPTVEVDGARPRTAEFQCPPGVLQGKYAIEDTYFQIDDRATIPINYPTVPAPDRTLYHSIKLYGFTQNEGIRKQMVPAGSVQAHATYAAYFNPLGVFTGTTVALNSSGFDVEPLIAGYNPGDETLLKIEDIYLWKWGAGFNWFNNLGVIAKAYPGEYRQPVIQVVYTGTWILEVFQTDVLRISQLPVEILISPRVGEDEYIPPTNGGGGGGGGGTTPSVPGIGGIYFLNPNKSEWHDSYYAKTGTTTPVEKKIPDPTIKTALIGE